VSEVKDIKNTTNDDETAKEPSSFKLVITLGIAGLLAGFVLVGTYIYTTPIIDANKAEALKSAIFKVLSGCDSFKELALVDGKLIEVKEDKKKKGGKEESKIFLGYNKNKEFIGFAIPGREPGFQDIIGVIYGYDPSNKIIIGFEVLESKETPGLGDKIFKDANFQENFKKLMVDPDIQIVKTGQKVNDNEVESITGATISSKAVVRLLNNSMDAWKTAIDEYIKINKLETVRSE
jgi:electron transport complex protein RnfG